MADLVRFAGHGIEVSYNHLGGLVGGPLDRLERVIGCDGLPVGFKLAASMGSEMRLLLLPDQLEQARP